MDRTVGLLWPLVGKEEYRMRLVLGIGRWIGLVLVRMAM